jgi:phospholipase/lecithinase/hemolysin
MATAMARITRRLLKIFLASLFLLGTTGANALFVNLFAFGDSLSDAGNAFALTGGAIYPPPYAQRASDGPVAVEHLAASLGIPAFGPSASGGTNYAVGGATTGVINTFIADGHASVAFTGMLSQVTAFASAPPLFDPAASLFFLLGGPNDLFMAFVLAEDPAAAASAAIANLATEIALLASLGAQHFLVPTLPDLGITPRAALFPDPTAVTALSFAFNLGLTSALSELESLLGIDIRIFDTFGFLNDVVANAAAFGFTNVTDPCFDRNALTLCSNPDQYMFWDDVHPTSRGHRIIGDRLYAALPEPVTLALLAVWLAGIAGMGTKDRAR